MSPRGPCRVHPEHTKPEWSLILPLPMTFYSPVSSGLAWRAKTEALCLVVLSTPRVNPTLPG